MKFYQLPNSNLFTHRLLFFSREATNETYGPLGLLSHIFALRSTFPLHFYSDLLNQKIQKYLAAFYLYYFIWRSIYQSYYNLSHVRLPILGQRTPEGIDSPFNTSGCEDLLSVCRGCLGCVAWFSYWFVNLGLYLREIPTTAVLQHPFGEIPT